MKECPNVFIVRHLDDAEQIKRCALSSKRAVVIGAGLIGLDVVSALLRQGLDVSIVEMGSRLLPLQLDETAAAAYQSLFEKAGASFYLGASVRDTVLQDGAVTAVKNVCILHGLRLLIHECTLPLWTILPHGGIFARKIILCDKKQIRTLEGAMSTHTLFCIFAPICFLLQNSIK